MWIQGGATPIKQHPYQINPQKWAQMKAELGYMDEIGAIEQGVSEWSSSPCIDFRKVNHVTRTDAYPIPRLEDCIDHIGNAKFVSKFDLLKGYWQVPLTEMAMEVSAFVMPECLYRCWVLPFGIDFSEADEFGNGRITKHSDLPRRCGLFTVFRGLST